VGVNKYEDHLWILPEDSADEALANGFLLEARVKFSRVRVLPPSGGWVKVAKDFEDEYADGMRKYGKRYLVFLVDFDSRFERRHSFYREKIPVDLADRVFVLGVLGEPEELSSALGRRLESIGKCLASECADDSYVLWKHEQLVHNTDELDRLVASVKPILFSDA
jgi:hypothetical protein